MNILRKAEEPPLSLLEKMKLFSLTYWKGIIIVITPVILLGPIWKDFFLGYYIAPHMWVYLTFVLMAVYWAIEAIPLPVTAFFPLIIFPMVGIMSTDSVARCYFNDTTALFVGSIMLAYAFEQSGLHTFVALKGIQMCGYSRHRVLIGLSFMTMLVSMVITNTAATLLMLPTTFALVKAFENQRLGNMYVKGKDGEYASRLTVCFFCAIAFSATIGGIGTIVGTATNMAFKGIFEQTFPEAPAYLSFGHFTVFTLPLMLSLEITLCVWLMIAYMGLFRPKSDDYKRAQVPPYAKKALERKVDEDVKKAKSMNMQKYMVFMLFLFALALFFCRSPTVFIGWADLITSSFSQENKEFIKDEVTVYFVIFLLCILPSTLGAMKHFGERVKYVDDLPKAKITSVLDWKPMHAVMPFSFMFLLGGGIALAEGAKEEISNLNGIIQEALIGFTVLPTLFTLFLIILITMFCTNFVSNVAVCNILGITSMQLAQTVEVNPLWYLLAVGYSSSFCFMLPIGTPGNVIVQNAAKIRTRDMMYAGLGISLATLLITWLYLAFYTYYIFGVMDSTPPWIGGSNQTATATTTTTTTTTPKPGP